MPPGPSAIVRGAHQGERAFTGTHTPAANTKATVTIAAPGLGRRNVVTSFDAVIANGASTPTGTITAITLVSGSTTKWGTSFGVQALIGDSVGIVKSNQWIVCGENEAVVLEFAAASGANTTQSVNIAGIIEELR